VAIDLYLIAAVIIVGASLAKVAEEYRLPYPIPLIIGGIILRQTIPTEGFLDIIGLDFIAQITLATVIFYAGLTMNLKELRLSIVNVALLATAGVMATSLIAGTTALLVFPTLTLAAFLIGAILSPTDPAALFSVLETGGVPVKRKLFSILEGEAVFNDATAAILVITVFEPLVIVELAQPWFIVVFQFLASTVAGFLIGLLVAYIIGKLILRTGETNISILTATTPFLAYGLGETLTVFGFHPGALAAAFAGIFLANSRRIGLRTLPQQTMRSTTNRVSFGLEVIVFILLGYQVDLQFILANPNIIMLGLAIAALVIFVARPAAVFLMTAHDRQMRIEEKIFVSWAGVKGVASAALSAIAVSILNNAADIYGVPEYRALGQTITSLIFVALMVSLILQGLTTPFLAEKLGVTEDRDAFEELIAERDATRQALLHLVDEYTEGNIDSELYNRLKAELEEEIYTIEDELRRLVAEREARLKELRMRQNLCQQKLEHYKTQFEKGNLSEAVFVDRKESLEDEIDELKCMRDLAEEERGGLEDVSPTA
jgi:cell volume regulation protein A